MKVPRQKKSHEGTVSKCKEFGGKNNRTGKPCEQEAGWGTDHFGTGRCKLHGGASTGRPPTHGRYSRYDAIKRPRIKELMEAFREDETPEELLPELELLRALIIDFVERYDEITEATIAWYASFGQGFKDAYFLWQGTHDKWHEAYRDWEAAWNEYRAEVERVQQHYRQGWPEPTREPEFPSPPAPPSPMHFAERPREMPDILSAGKFIVQIGALIEKRHKMRQEGTLTLAEVDAALERYGLALVESARVHIADEDLRQTFLTDIEERWNGIIIASDRGRPGDSSDYRRTATRE